MAKEEAMTRVLSTQFAMEAVGTTAGDEITLGYNYGGWSTKVINTGFAINGFVYKINTFDLSGYTLQDKTLFPTQCIFQDLNIFSGGSAVGFTRMTIVSTTPLNEDNLTQMNNIGMWDTPGSLNSGFNLDHILRGRMEQYHQDSTLSNTLIKTKEINWGSGDSTAADKVWVAEVYFIAMGGTVQTFYIPASAVVMPSIVDKEPEMEYFMRLARSIEPVY